MRHDLDPSRSSITIHASSSIHPITTEAPVAGWIDVSLDARGSVDPDAPVDGQVEFDLGGMRSGNPLIDREAERRLDIRRHPTVTGRLTALCPTADGGGAPQPGREHRRREGPEMKMDRTVDLVSTPDPRSGPPALSDGRPWAPHRRLALGGRTPST